MTSTAPATLSEQEIATILATPKHMDGDMDWNAHPNKSAFLAADFLIFDSNGATIPGLTVQLHYRRGSVPEDCLYRFTIFCLKGNSKRRAYQIEVVPDEKKSHQGSDGNWYGPHQHFGEAAVKFDPKPAMGCGAHEA